MRKATFLLAVLFVTALYNTPAVLAQSSGSFSAASNGDSPGCSRAG